MTVKLDLSAKVEAGLQAEAEVRGLSLEAYLEQVIQECAVNRPPSLSAEEWEREFDEWVSSFPDSPALSDEGISRDSMYPDRW